MAFQNEAWFHHAVSDNVTQLAQQQKSKVMGSVRTKEGIVGKTYPFHRIGSIDMQAVAARDADTQYANPPQSKRRAGLRDFSIAVLVDDLDELKELPNAGNEFSQILAYSRNRKLDDIVLGGALASATVVDESAETTSLQALPAGQIIANGGFGMTMTKLRLANRLLDDQDVPEDDRYLFLAPAAIEDLLADTTVTSSDFSSLNAIQVGGFPWDATWMGFHVRKTTRLVKTGNIRSCIAYHKNGIGLAVGTVKGVEIDKAVHKNNATQVLLKLSAGSVRVDDLTVVQIDFDETV